MVLLAVDLLAWTQTLLLADQLDLARAEPKTLLPAAAPRRAVEPRTAPASAAPPTKLALAHALTTAFHRLAALPVPQTWTPHPPADPPRTRQTSRSGEQTRPLATKPHRRSKQPDQRSTPSAREQPGLTSESSCLTTAPQATTPAPAAQGLAKLCLGRPCAPGVGAVDQRSPTRGDDHRDSGDMGSRSKRSGVTLVTVVTSKVSIPTK